MAIVDGHGNALNTGFITCHVFYYLDLESALFGPSHVHSHQDLGPVLTFCPACSGINCQDSIVRICLAGKGTSQFDIINFSNKFV